MNFKMKSYMLKKKFLLAYNGYKEQEFLISRWSPGQAKILRDLSYIYFLGKLLVDLFQQFDDLTFQQKNLTPLKKKNFIIRQCFLFIKQRKDEEKLKIFEFK